MITIWKKDALRSRVEHASGGRQTVLYTRRGQPSYLNVVTRHDLAAGHHPAFVLNGQPRQEFFYGTYGGVIRDGELLSLPGQPPASGMDFDQACAAARACGPGWHLATNAERAALVQWAREQGWSPRGNTDQGRDAVAPQDAGQRVDGLAAGRADGNPATLTGSGPAAWRLDGTPQGIADLCGNLWEWTAGLRLVDGEIQVIADNDAAWADGAALSAAWRAIRLSDGELVSPGATGTAKFDASRGVADGNAGAPVLSDHVRFRAGPAGSAANLPGLMDAPFHALRAAAGIEPPARLRDLALYPAGHGSERAQAYLRNYGERLMLAGGAWYSGLDAGLTALCLSHPRHHASATVGARPAFLL
ncbi:hypothetical protein [Achromobacter sp. DH1f]|uniref:hypothetical protein n=1 Tax=Achromobacter sp. DH1f TaxID=1397275 RepID=UPI00046A560C|nr:hypothetical protein [Achromobacter sp. DH1f]